MKAVTMRRLEGSPKPNANMLPFISPCMKTKSLLQTALTALSGKVTTSHDERPSCLYPLTQQKAATAPGEWSTAQGHPPHHRFGSRAQHRDTCPATARALRFASRAAPSRPHRQTTRKSSRLFKDNDERRAGKGRKDSPPPPSAGLAPSRLWPAPAVPGSPPGRPEPPPFLVGEAAGPLRAPQGWGRRFQGRAPER